MKLNWEINNCRVLVAKVGEVTYHVAPDVISLWKPKKYSTVSEGKVEAEGAVYGMSLTNAIAWCEKDAERPEGCPAQPPAMDPVAPKTSDGVPKFPNTLDASVWASRATAWFGAFKVPDLTEWFDAALARGYREGREDKQDLLDCFTPHQLHNMASGGKSNQAAELLEAEEAGRRLTLNQHRARYRMNAASPSTQVPEPPSVEDRLARLESELSEWAKYYGAELIRVEGKGEIKWKELSDRIDKQPDPGPFPADRLRDMARRIAELESWLGTKKYAPEDNLASKTWTKLEQLTNRLERLEART